MKKKIPEGIPPINIIYGISILKVKDKQINIDLKNKKTIFYFIQSTTIKD